MGIFPETKWTVLAEATLNGGEDGRKYLGEVCEKYKDSVDELIRFKGVSEDRVQDLRQEFFVHLIEGKFFKKASPARGKFRSFLSKALQNFLIDDFRKITAMKRGGGNYHEELHENVAETEEEEISAFDLAWAETIYVNALARVESEVKERRSHESWEVLSGFLNPIVGGQDYNRVAQVLEVGISGAKVEVSRMRKKFRSYLRTEVSSTVDEPHEIDEELTYLREVMVKLWGLKNA